ncbi:MAG: nucleotidyltransferase family protein [Clostridia bacterium]|nr:nucleotidyltransferase family protein [Clostridia bacterium]
MAKVCGVIAEYDPFHNGHALHLKKARDATGADFVVVLMSGYVTQRGHFALFDPADRARMALECGADIVFSVPFDISCRDAESYALGMVSLFHRMGCVDCLSFGSEYGDTELLLRIADSLESPETQILLGQQIHSGLSYPRAVEKVLDIQGLAGPGIISSPNVILAVSYIRALKRLSSPIRCYPVQREGDYHSLTLSPTHPSAFSLRRAFLLGGPESIRPCVPASVFEQLQEIWRSGSFMDEKKADLLLIGSLLKASPNDLRRVSGAGEGIENHILKEAGACLSLEQLTERACTTHFTRARLSRLLMRFFLDKARLSPQEDAFLYLRGFRSEASPLIKLISEKIPCYQTFASLEKSGVAGEECFAAKCWNLCAGRPSSLLYSRGVIRSGAPG